MRKKIILFTVIVVAIALFFSFGLGIIITAQSNTHITEHKIKQITKVYANNYTTDENFYKKLDENVRVTVIDANGKVLGDSDSTDTETMENHLDRREIVSALNGNPETVTRYSGTLGVEMMYYAEKIDVDGGYVFVRVAIPVESVRYYVLKTIPMWIAILLVSLAVAMMAGVPLCGELIKPLKLIEDNLTAVSKGSYKPVVPSTGDEDVNKVLSDINDISAKIQSDMNDISIEKERLDVIINNVSDGIIVFGCDGKIELINRKAGDIFNIADGVNKKVNYLTSDRKIIKAILDAVYDGTETLMDFECGQSIYLTAVKRAENGCTIVVLSDITAEKNAQKNRSEFFANASHELKTPMTSIMGFNEMINIKSTDKSIIDCSSYIKKECARMMSLIEDMLKLSQLENTQAVSASRVDVKSVADEVAESLSSLSKSKNVRVSVKGKATVFAEREHVFMLIKNLIENGIRYNRDGGKVDVEVRSVDSGTEISVSDNGIGIDDVHKSRVFERFYRVDKSRSRDTGGTGLGLSIVKHIADIYNARVELDSKLGVGTTVKVAFPS